MPAQSESSIQEPSKERFEPDIQYVNCADCNGLYLSDGLAEHRRSPGHVGATRPENAWSCPACQRPFPSNRRAEHLSSREHRTVLLNRD
jgi:hypothetical protein